MTPTEALFLTPSWNNTDLSYVGYMCKELGMEPGEFFAIPTIESWLNPRSSVPEDNGKDVWFVAVGLTQFTRIVAIQYKWIESGPAEKDSKTGEIIYPKSFMPWKAWSDKFHKMSVEEQLPFIREFLYPFSKKYDLSKAYTIYQCFAASSSLEYAKKPSDIIYPKGSEGYNGNSGLDLDKSDGGISVNDLKMATDEAKTRKIYKAIMQRMDNLISLSPTL